MKKVVGWIFGIILLALVVAFAGGYYLTEVALRPHFERGEEPCFVAWAENYPDLKPWADSLRAAATMREEQLAAPDGTRLHGYLIPAPQPTNRTAIVVHGYTDHPFGMLHIARLYREELGCNILLPTLRFHGKSDGEWMGMGWQDRLDVKQWIEAVPQFFGKNQQLIVHGLSMGAATVMMLSGESDLPATVRCIVEDCGYTSVWEQFKKELKEDYHLPAFPILHASRWVARWRFGWDFRAASALDAVSRSTVPMLFIHGGNDHYVPTRMVYPLHEAKVQGEKMLWVAPDSGHADAYMDHPTRYTEVVKDFCERCFE